MASKKICILRLLDYVQILSYLFFAHLKNTILIAAKGLHAAALSNADHEMIDLPAVSYFLLSKYSSRVKARIALYAEASL